MLNSCILLIASVACHQLTSSVIIYVLLCSLTHKVGDPTRIEYRFLILSYIGNKGKVSIE